MRQHLLSLPPESSLLPIQFIHSLFIYLLWSFSSRVFASFFYIFIILFQIYDPNNQRYEVPVETPKVTKKSSEQDYLVSFTHYPFGFAVTRKSTGRVLFNSTAGAMIFEDQFLQLSTFLPSTNIYGLGEHVDSFKLNTTWQKLVMFARDG